MYRRGFIKLVGLGSAAVLTRVGLVLPWEPDLNVPLAEDWAVPCDVCGETCSLLISKGSVVRVRGEYICSRMGCADRMLHIEGWRVDEPWEPEIGNRTIA